MTRFIKTAAALVLMLAMVFGTALMAVPEKGILFGLRAEAAKTVVSGVCGADGNNVTWVLDDGGTLTITTTGSNEDAKPKGIKSDTGIIVSGGSFSVSVKSPVRFSPLTLKF